METMLSAGKEFVLFKKAEDLIKISTVINGEVVQTKMVSEEHAKFNFSILKELGYIECKEQYES